MKKFPIPFSTVKLLWHIPWKPVWVLMKKWIHENQYDKDPSSIWDIVGMISQEIALHAPYGFPSM